MSECGEQNLIGLLFVSPRAKDQVKNKLLQDFNRFQIHAEENTLIIGNFGVLVNKNKLNTIKVYGNTLIIYGNLYNYEILESAIDYIETQPNEFNNRLKSLNGEFLIIVLYNNQKSIIITDPMGLVKIYGIFLEEEGLLVFSSRIQSINKIINKLEFSKYKLELSPEGITEFFRYGYFPRDITLFKGVFVFPSGSTLRMNESHKLEMNFYYQFKFLPSNKLDLDVLSKEFYNLWMNAVKIRLKVAKKNKGKNKYILVPISGGLDSRLILATIYRLINKYDWIDLKDILCFSYGSQNSFDLDLGKKIAYNFGFKHLSLLPDLNNFSTQLNLMTDYIESMKFVHDSVPPIKYMEELSKRGNEIFTGYPADVFLNSVCVSQENLNKVIITKSEHTQELTKFIKKFVKMTDYDLKKILNIPFKQSSSSKTVQPTWSYPVNLWDILDTWNINHRVKNHSWYGVYRFDSNFTYYSPFFDRNIINFVSQLNIFLRYKPKPKLRQNKNINFYHYFLLNYFPEFFKYPIKNNYGYPLYFGLNNPLLLLSGLVHVKIPHLTKRYLKRRYLQNKNENYIDFNDLAMVNSEFKDFLIHQLNSLLQNPLFIKSGLKQIIKRFRNGEYEFSKLSYLIAFNFYLRKIKYL